jgi:class 3 adenylate cyclase/tetratricopeptide (TPR) repeat protein
MEYRVLGPLEVLAASGEKLALGGVMQQSVLASLLLRAGRTVALERLIDDMWDEPPETAARTIQAYVSRLRHELPKGAIESRHGGYRLVVDGGTIDLETFERRAEEGHRALAAGQHEEATRLLRSALALWRGPALAGLRSEALRRQAERLEELRLSALENRIEADLGCARDAEIVPELKTLVAEHPFRERLRTLLMKSLYRSGRPGEALALYRETRRLLVDELGMEPGQELRELEQAILRQDAGLEAPKRRRSTAQAAPVPMESEPQIEQPPPREVRKTVTILFCDIVDSTGQGESTDPEVVRSRLARFFDEMKTVIERHGGTVEKFIGDAVMAVFGVPIAHEDDALRACRAAIEMQEASPGLEIEGRIGLMTGEVVTGTEERLATGDAVNVAARLEQAALPGEVLVGEPTVRLVREAAEVEPVEPLELKGKAEPVPAYRLLRVRDAPEWRHDVRFVGREHELALLQEALERMRAEKRCELVTVVGEAGVGKSRLVAEALAPIEAMVVRGRCLPYGEGITYWPVVEVLKQLDVLPADEAAAAAIRSLLGVSEMGTSAEEIAWAFRKTLEQAAAERPLVVVFDDIQWGAETFRDLIEHVALLSSGASILMLCMARPELTERRPAWTVTLRLEPLAVEEVEELIAERAPEQLRERIARAAGGNPLFIEEMLAMAGEADGEVVVPPTLQALLAARLDQLETAERSVLERGAIEGEIFHRGAVQALSPDGTQVTLHLAALVRKGLIRPDKPQLDGEDGFRFRHLLLRDAAYEALPKAVRAELHERLATWLEQHGAELVELDELLGYHLEQACHYRAELGLPSDDELAATARRRLTTAGRRALLRQDAGAAVRLLERAIALAPPAELDLALEVDLVDALLFTGNGVEALRRAGSLAERASAAGDRVAELCGRIKVDVIRLYREPEGATEKLAALLKQALPVFEAAEDDFALYLGYFARGHVAAGSGQMDAALDAFERAFVHARRAGLPHQPLVGRFAGRFRGTTPVSELLAWVDEQKAPGEWDYFLRRPRAHALAMVGRFEEARAILAEARAELADRGGELALALTMDSSGEVALLAGDPASAVEFGEEAFGLFGELGEKRAQSAAAGALAQALYALDRLEEAEAWAARAAELGTSHDAWIGMLWRQVRAKVLARRGEHEEAERLAREAVAVGEDTDWLDGQGDAHADLAEVLALADRPQEAVGALEEALARYERKENIVMAERVRARLTELQPSGTAAERP